LIPQGIVSSIICKELSIEDLKTAKELILLGGYKITPILKLDDKPVGNGETGEICKVL